MSKDNNTKTVIAVVAFVVLLVVAAVRHNNADDRHYLGVVDHMSKSEKPGGDSGSPNMDISLVNIFSNTWCKAMYGRDGLEDDELENVKSACVCASDKAYKKDPDLWRKVLLLNTDHSELYGDGKSGQAQYDKTTEDLIDGINALMKDAYDGCAASNDAPSSSEIEKRFGPSEPMPFANFDEALDEDEKVDGIGAGDTGDDEAAEGDGKGGNGVVNPYTRNAIAPMVPPRDNSNLPLEARDAPPLASPFSIPDNMKDIEEARKIQEEMRKDAEVNSAMSNEPTAPENLEYYPNDGFKGGNAQQNQNQQQGEVNNGAQAEGQQAAPIQPGNDVAGNAGANVQPSTPNRYLTQEEARKIAKAYRKEGQPSHETGEGSNNGAGQAGRINESTQSGQNHNGGMGAMKYATPVPDANPQALGFANQDSNEAKSEAVENGQANSAGPETKSINEGATQTAPKNYSNEAVKPQANNAQNSQAGGNGANVATMANGNASKAVKGEPEISETKRNFGETVKDKIGTLEDRITGITADVKDKSLRIVDKARVISQGISDMRNELSETTPAKNNSMVGKATDTQAAPKPDIKNEGGQPVEGNLGEMGKPATVEPGNSQASTGNEPKQNQNVYKEVIRNNANGQANANMPNVKVVKTIITEKTEPINGAGSQQQNAAPASQAPAKSEAAQNQPAKAETGKAEPRKDDSTAKRDGATNEAANAPTPKPRPSLNLGFDHVVDQSEKHLK